MSPTGKQPPHKRAHTTCMHQEKQKSHQATAESTQSHATVCTILCTQADRERELSTLRAAEQEALTTALSRQVRTVPECWVQMASLDCQETQQKQQRACQRRFNPKRPSPLPVKVTPSLPPAPCRRRRSRRRRPRRSGCGRTAQSCESEDHAVCQMLMRCSLACIDCHSPSGELRAKIRLLHCDCCIVAYVTSKGQHTI